MNTDSDGYPAPRRMNVFTACAGHAEVIVKVIVKVKVREAIWS